MRIRTHLIVSVAAALVVAAATQLVVWDAAREAHSSDEDLIRAQTIAREVSALIVLTQEYANHFEARAHQQWQERMGGLNVALQETSASRSIDADALAAARTELHRLPELFDRLDELADEPNGAFAARRKQFLVDQLLTASQSVADHTTRWIRSASASQRHASARLQNTIVAAMGLMLLLIVAQGAWLGRRVLRPLRGLEDATRAIGEGRLEVRLDDASNDELGEVARRFDAMTAALAHRTEQLHDEVARRDQAERRIRAITDNVPALVAYVGRDERYEFTNAYYQHLHGRDPQDFIGRTMREMLGEQAYAELQPHIAAALAGRRVRYERQAQELGPQVHLLVDYQPDVDAQGRVCGFNVMVLDISERKATEAALASSERRLREVTNSIPAIVGYFDRDQRCVYANQPGLKFYSLTAEQVRGMHMSEILGADNYAQHLPHVQAALGGRRSFLEGHVLLGERDAHFQAHLIPDKDAGGVVQGYYTMTFDVTPLKRSERERAAGEHRLKTITDNLPVLISYIDEHSHVRFCNNTFRHWLGIDPAAAVGLHVADMVGPQLYEERRVHFERALAGERVRFEIQSMARGQMVFLQTEYIPDVREDGSVAGIYTLSVDVTEQKKVEQQLSVLARFDPLTGLPNRRQFEEKLQEAIARSTRSGHLVSLLFLDVDKFKGINDTLGHAAGDEVLKEFALRLTKCVRKTDTVCRLAGDEFVVILEGLHTFEEPQFVARKILATIAPPFDVLGRELKVSTSIGVAVQEPQATSVARLLAMADEALYEAKAAGRNAYRCAPRSTAA